MTLQPLYGVIPKLHFMSAETLLQKRELLGITPDILKYYLDPNVGVRLQQTEWLTPEHIVWAKENIPPPEYDLHTGVHDPFLRAYLRAPEVLDQTHELFTRTVKTVKNSLIGGQGHPFDLRYVGFIDDAAKADLSATYAIPLKDSFSRDVIYFCSPTGILQCLVAPESHRDQIITMVINYNKNDPYDMNGALLWTKLVLIAAQNSKMFV